MFLGLVNVERFALTYALTPEFLGRTIARIYDCAVDPQLWPETLCTIRDEMDLAYVQLFFAAPPNNPAAMQSFQTPWDESWFHRLIPLLPTIPGMAQMRSAEVDQPIAQMQLFEPEAFYETEFYRTWAGPQGLGDACNTTVLRRPEVEAWFSGTTRRKRGLLTDQDLTTFRLLAPHVRRALMIADLIDEGRFNLALHRILLDQLSVAVFLVDGDGRVVLRNDAAARLIEDRVFLTEVSGFLRPVQQDLRAQFLQAIARAAQDESSLGTWGNGMALRGPDDAGAVSYVLPLGRSERRRALGPGHAAVFVSTKSGATPPPAEVLSALTGLTMAESRIALAIAAGQPTDLLAADQNISIHTLRKHLSNTYEKTGLTTQTALAAYVNGFRLPVHRP